MSTDDTDTGKMSTNRSSELEGHWWHICWDTLVTCMLTDTADTPSYIHCWYISWQTPVTYRLTNAGDMSIDGHWWHFFLWILMTHLLTNTGDTSIDGHWWHFYLRTRLTCLCWQSNDSHQKKEIAHLKDAIKSAAAENAQLITDYEHELEVRNVTRQCDMHAVMHAWMHIQSCTCACISCWK